MNMKMTWPWTWVAAQTMRAIFALERIAVVQSAAFAETKKADEAHLVAAKELLEATDKLNTAMRAHIAECRQWQLQLTQEVRQATTWDPSPKKKGSVH